MYCIVLYYTAVYTYCVLLRTIIYSTLRWYELSGESYFGKMGIVTWNITVVFHGDVNNTPVWGMLKSFGCVQTFLEIHLEVMYTVNRNTGRVVGPGVHNENIALSFTSPRHP